RAEQQAEQQWSRIILEQSETRRPPQPTRHFKQGEVLARLSISRLDSHWIVLEGAAKTVLRHGPGHMSQTALPGSPGNCVIAGHRDTQFRVLRNVEIGENITLEIGGRTYVYRVTECHVVSPSDTRPLASTATPTLTLVTCYPFYYVGPAPKRFVIHAELKS